MHHISFSSRIKHNFPIKPKKATVEIDFENKLIDSFEDDIKTGTPTDIESFLALCPEDSKQRILLELISIEIFHRVKKGRRVCNSDYSRFGEEAENHANRLQEQFRTLDGPKMASLMRFKNSVNPSKDG